MPYVGFVLLMLWLLTLRWMVWYNGLMINCEGDT